MRRLARGPADEQEKWKRERQPPEARGDRTRVGEADQPGTEGERDIAEKERGECETVLLGCVAGQGHSRHAELVSASMLETSCALHENGP
jgi:hypothetical protein